MNDYDEWRVARRASQRIRYKSIIKMINKIVISKDNALDVGCGNGFFSNFLSKKFKRVVAIDIDPIKIQRCRPRFNNENIIFLKNDFIVEEMEFHQFDLITALEMIFYIPQNRWDNFFFKCKTNLKTNGMFVFSMNILTSDDDKNKYLKILDAIKKYFNVYKIIKIYRKVYYKIEMPLLYFINSVEYIKKARVFYLDDWRNRSYSQNIIIDRLLKSDLLFHKGIVFFLMLGAKFILKSKILYHFVTFFSYLFVPEKTFSQIVLYCKPKF